MRTVFEEEEEEDLAPAHEQPERELTLSSTTLLVIFFGLVLVCGLFFGLGYTLGRRSSPTEASQEAAASPVNTGTSASAPISSLPKPSAASASPTVASDPAPASSASDSQSADVPAETPAQPAASTPPTPTVKPALQELKPAGKGTAPAANVQPAKLSTEPGAAPSGIMVQIAAVSNPADANVLIGALQKHGYTVAARRQASDTLIHVQIGPFATRTEAITMRQKLLGDGYNAILK